MADLTDTANVDAAGATMNTDTSLVGNGYFLDEDSMASNDATKVPSQQSVKAYVDALVQGAVILQGDWDADTNTPNITGTTPTGYAWRVSVAGSTSLGGITDWAVGDMAVKTASSWLKIDNEDIAAVWGNISGTLSNQTDLQNALDAKQPLDATLTSISSLGNADQMIYTTATDVWAETPLTAFARTILDDASGSEVRTTIGAGTGDG